jgi:hypothetical protein
MGENKVARLDRLVAGEASFVLRFVGRFAVLIELSEPPSTRGGVLFRVLDHKLKVPIRPRSGNEGLGTAKDFVVFLRRDVTPG